MSFIYIYVYINIYFLELSISVEVDRFEEGCKFMRMKWREVQWSDLQGSPDFLGDFLCARVTSLGF